MFYIERKFISFCYNLSMVEDVLKILANNKLTFSPADLRIYYVIRLRWENIEKISMNQIAEEADVSWGSISKFFNKNGFDGWKGFKQAVYFNKNNIQNKNITITETVMSQVATDKISRLIEKVSKKVLDHRKVIVVGSDYGEFIGMDFARKCNLINLNVEHDTYGSFEKHIDGDEYFIFISMSGTREKEIKQYIEYIKVATDKTPEMAYFSSSPTYIDIKEMGIQIQPSTFNHHWRYEKQIPRISLFTISFLIDKLFEIIFDTNKEKNIQLLEIIRKSEK